MTIFGVDYAFAPHPSIAALKEANVKFVCRYLSPYASKNLTANEAKSLRDAGIAIVVVWESSAKRAESGKAAGIADAKEAVSMMKSLGMPADQVLYMAVDYDTTVGPNITGYFQGVASVIGLDRTGVYGGYAVVKGCLDADLVNYAWQTYAWSGGKWDPVADIQQYSNDHTLGGGSVDYNRAMVADYGQWTADGQSPSPPPPTPASGLVVDGEMGPKTVEALQKALHVKADGQLGPVTIKALQRHVGASADGVLGQKTIKALQKHLGTMQSGGLTKTDVRALQTALNAGTF